MLNNAPFKLYLTLYKYININYSNEKIKYQQFIVYLLLYN